MERYNVKVYEIFCSEVLSMEVLQVALASRVPRWRGVGGGFNTLSPESSGHKKAREIIFSDILSGFQSKIYPNLFRVKLKEYGHGVSYSYRDPI